MRKLLLFILSLVATLPAYARIDIDPSMSQTTIQALFTANPGELFVIAGGTYPMAANPANPHNCALVFPAADSKINPPGLTGVGEAIFQGTGGYPIMCINSVDRDTVDSMTFDGGGIFVAVGSVNLTLQSDNFKNIDCSTDPINSSGIYIEGVTHSEIDSNVFVNLGATCNAQQSDSNGAATGIYVLGFDRTGFQHNSFLNVFDGIVAPITSSANNGGTMGAFNFNAFYGIHRKGINISGISGNPANVQVMYNTYTNPLNPYASSAAITVGTSQGAKITNNVLTANNNSSGSIVPQAILLGSGVTGAVVNDNKIQGYWNWGVSLTAAVSTQVTGNYICGPTMNTSPSSGTTPATGNANGFISWVTTSGGGTFTSNTTDAGLLCPQTAVDHIYQQRFSAAMGDFIDNGYPSTILPEDQSRVWAQPIYETNSFNSYTYDGVNTLTLTINSGTTSAVGSASGDQSAPHDLIRIRNTSNRWSTIACWVFGSTSTTITLDIRFCDGGFPVGSFPEAGTTPVPGSYYEIISGPTRDATGSWKITDTSSDTSTTAKYYIESNTQEANTGAVGCDTNLHTTQCYSVNPELDNVQSMSAYVNSDNTPGGNCVQTGTLDDMNVVWTGPKSFDFTFTSNADPTKFTTFHILRCKEGAGAKPSPHPGPGYMQSFTNREVPIWNQTFGVAGDQYTIWGAMVSDDGLGDATIETFNPPAGETFVHNGGKLPEAVFHSGTVTDGYRIPVCADKDPTSCGWMRIYVKAGSPPALNPDKILQTPCEIDPVMIAAGGHVIEYGPGQTITQPMDIPASYTWGSIFRYHGETGTPGNPVSIKNYWYLETPSNALAMTSTTSVPAAYFCGIPASTGEIPWIDGENATGNANVGFLGQGQLFTINSITPALPNPDNYDGNTQLVHHVAVAGMGYKNDAAGIQYYAPGQTPPSGTKQNFSNGESIRFFATDQYAVIGNRSIFVANPMFSDCSSKAGWKRNCNPYAYYLGNHVEKYGNPGDPTEHPMYMQDVGDVILGTLEDGAIDGSQGTACFSFRANQAFYMYNRCVTLQPYNGASGVGGDTEVQDNAYYVNPDMFTGPTPAWGGPGDCGDGTSGYPNCPTVGAAFGGLNTFAAFSSQHRASFFMQGNAIHLNSGNCGFGISNTNGDNSQTMQHNAYSNFNIFACDYNGVSLFQDLRIGSQGGNSMIAQPYDWPHGYFENNIQWWQDDNGCAYNCVLANSNPTGQMNFRKNLTHVGQINVASNIQTNIGFGAGGNPSGINQSLAYNMTGGVYFAETKIGGWLSSNFVTSATKPFDDTTLVPFSASLAVGSTQPLTFPARMYPPIFNAIDANMNLTRRTQLAADGYTPTTMGAFDAAGGPTISSIAVSPVGPFHMSYPSSFQFTATCFLSDGTNSDCTDTVTWSNGGSTSFSVNTIGVVTTLLHAGSGTLTATQSGVTSNAVTVVVTTPYVMFGAGAKIGVGSGSSVKIF